MGETVIHILFNILTLILLMVPFSAAMQSLASVKRPWLPALVKAALFVLTTALSMLLPVRLASGPVFDGRYTALALAGFLGGPAAGLPALALSFAMRAFMGGRLLLTDLAAQAAAWLAGWLCSLGSGSDRPRIRILRAAGMALTSALASQGALYSLTSAADRDALLRLIYLVLPSTAGSTFLCVCAYHFLLEQGRHNALYSAVLQSGRDALLVFRDGKVVEYNRRARELFELEADKLFGTEAAALSPPNQPGGIPSADRMTRQLQRAEAGEAFSFRWDFRTGDGRTFTAETSLFPVDLDEKRYVGAIIRDISLRMSQENMVAMSERVFDASSESILITDGSGNIVYANPAFVAMTGYQSQELIGKNPRIIKSDRHDAEFFKRMWEAIRRDGFWAGDIWNRRRSGETFPCRERILAFGEEGGQERYIGLLRDMTELARTEDELAFRRNRDPLTGFHNREGFLALLDRDLGVAGERRRVVLMALDISGFRAVNQGYGHKAGDLVLEELAGRIKAAAREGLEIARVGSDEFLIELIDTARGGHSVFSLWEALNACFEKPFNVPGGEISLSMCLGIASARRGDTGLLLLKRAEIALEQAKRSGKGAYAFFQEGMERRAVDRLHMSRRLKLAIDGGGIDVAYQPKIDLRSGLVSGVEALARWRDAELGPVSPAAFIPLAEENGLIVALGRQVMEKVMDDLPRLRGLPAAVNLSVRQFRDSSLADEIAALAARHSADPSRIELEITESVFIDNLEEVAGICRGLKALGFALALDDFGTGYSSLTYLSGLPFDTLKLDKGFVVDIEREPRKRALIDAVVALARALSICTVVEGIEDPRTEALLTELGCDYGQGFLYSEALPIADVLTFIDSRGVTDLGTRRRTT
jgi:diguanylate cyclase (GGDEF)-like protein/PAS domain S-box-containing protein